MRKVSTTIQLPRDLYEALNEYKARTGASKNVIIERALRAFFEGRVLDLPEDLMERLREIEELYGSPPSFVVERALRIFFAEDIEMRVKRRRAAEQSQAQSTA